jgi:hypothetical protein
MLPGRQARLAFRQWQFLQQQAPVKEIVRLCNSLRRGRSYAVIVTCAADLAVERLTVARGSAMTPAR